MSESSSRGKPAAPPSPSRGRLFLKTVPPVAGLEAVSQSLDSPCPPLSVHCCLKILLFTEQKSQGRVS